MNKRLEKLALLAALAASGMTLLAVSCLPAGTEAPSGRVLMQQAPNSELEQSLATVSLDLRSAEDSEREAEADEELSRPDGDQLWWGRKRRRWKRWSGEFDENHDRLGKDHPYKPTYKPLKELEGTPEREREEQMWGPWMQGYTTYWGAPRGIGYARAQRAQASLKV